MAEHPQQRNAAGTPGEKLLRLLAGISTEELTDPEKAARMIERTVRMIAAYIIVAGFALFFLAIPSFVELDGRLHTKNFTTFFWIGSPFFDCLILLGLSLFLGRTKNLPTALGLAGVAGFESYFYMHYASLSDFVTLIMCLMVLIHALQILGLFVFGRYERPPGLAE